MTTDGMEKARRLIAEEREKKTGFLDLGNLQLTEVPGELFELTHLRSLNVGSWYVDERGGYKESANGGDESRNALATLPDGLDALGKLVALSLAHNPVSDLSPLEKLTALQSLNCSGTQVRDLTPLIGLASLDNLAANRCHLSDLPFGLVRSETLSTMVLHETTIPGIPAELLSPDVFSSCLEALRTHLTDLEAGPEEVQEAKLVVLGTAAWARLRSAGASAGCRTTRRCRPRTASPSPQNAG